MIATRDNRQGTRLRAGVERLYAAQLEALERGPAAEHDAYSASRQLLENLGEMGSLLVRLLRTDAEASGVRLRLVTLAVGCANTLAELVSLAFEVEGAQVAKAGSPGGELVHAPGAAAVGGSSGVQSQAKVRTSLRVVTDANILLVEQLKRLMRNAQRQEWCSPPPGELWRSLLVQVAGLFPLVARLEAGELSEAEAKELNRLTAEAANDVAFIRFYPRLPTA
jgi:hypothetical protein